MDVDVRYVGFDIPNEFVVGYGLDYAERYRNLPFVGTLAPARLRPRPLASPPPADRPGWPSGTGGPYRTLTGSTVSSQRAAAS